MTASAASTNTTPPPQPWWKFTVRSWKGIADHGGTVALLLPVLSVALFVVRCFVVSRFNFSVATDLIELSDPVELIRNTAVGMVQLLLLVVTLIVLAVSGEAFKLRRMWRGLAALGLGVIGTMYQLFQQYSQPLGPLGALGALGVPVLFFCVGYEVADAHDFWPFPLNSKRWPHVAFGALIALFVGFAVVATGLNVTSMWLPPERVVVKGEPPATLYVISDSDDSLVVFDQGAHTVRRIPASTVISRQFCTPRWSHRNGMPACP